MKKLKLTCMVLFIMAGCRQVYDPPILKVNTNFLVVDGFINSTPNGITTINLSRTKSLLDTTGMSAEQNAQVNIENKSGSVYPLVENAPGSYGNSIFINNTDQYRINITTSDGARYSSDFVPVKQSPPIDSLTWEQPENLTIFTYTHDASNNSRYYRWDYSETWEYHAAYESVWGVNNGIVFVRDSSTQIYRCWSSDNSKDIYVANTTNLSQDRIVHVPVAVLPIGSPKIAVRYSINVSQHVLTKEAYDFWLILQKNTQKIGSLFDPQPSQLKSNIHCVTNPGEPVMGYLSAGSVETKRIFIKNTELTNWVSAGLPVPACGTLQIATSFPNFNFPDTNYVPYYYLSRALVVIIPKPCVNCLLYGGTNIKPLFW